MATIAPPISAMPPVWLSLPPRDIRDLIAYLATRNSPRAAGGKDASSHPRRAQKVSVPSTYFQQNDEHPVVNMSWNDAKQFCEWLSKVTGKEWRLPTNAEWEAAVGTTKYPWGEYYPPKWDDGNYAVLEDGKEDPALFGMDGIKRAAPVGSFKPNALGFYDLGGNVLEWMRDGLDEMTGTRGFRGGSWYGYAGICAVAYRAPYSPEGRNGRGMLGFRVALSSVP